MKRRRGVFGGAGLGGMRAIKPLVDLTQAHAILCTPSLRDFALWAASTFGPVPGEAGSLAPYVC